MNEKTVIGLVRHGVTAWNIEKRAQGHTNIPLHQEGIHQATLLAKQIDRERWDVILSSDLQRALHTAMIIKSFSSTLREIPVRTDVRLRERFYGQLEGTTLSERIAKWGKDWEMGEYEIESEEAFRGRVWSFLQEVVSQYPGKGVLLVTHGGFIRRVLRMIWPDQNHDTIHNTSLTIVEHVNRRWHCSLYNCTDHIQ